MTLSLLKRRHFWIAALVLIVTIGILLRVDSTAPVPPPPVALATSEAPAVGESSSPQSLPAAPVADVPAQSQVLVAQAAPAATPPVAAPPAAPPPVVTAPIPGPIFQVAGPTTGQPLIPGSAAVMREKLAGRKPVGRVTPLEPRSLDNLTRVKPGDTINIPLNDRETVVGKVQFASVPAPGAVSVIGSLVGREGTFSLERGGGKVLGHIAFQKQGTAYRLEQEDASGLVLKEVLLEEIVCLPPAGMEAAPPTVTVLKPGAQASPPAPAEAPLLQAQALTVAMNSRPSATIQFYLNFDGETVTGTSWNTAYNNGGNPIVAQPSGLTAAQVTAVFNEVAEHFRAFNVNVTTDGTKYAQAAQPQRMKCIVTPTNFTGSSSTLGIAYLNTYGGFSVNAVCWAFTHDVPTFGIASTAVSAAHEIGHTLSLSHDGTASLGYYQGHGQGSVQMLPFSGYNDYWGPIMGSPAQTITNGSTANVRKRADVVQWSMGEYSGANRQEDDVGIIAGKVGYSPDEAGDTQGAAFSLSLGVNQAGVISSANDPDYFSFASGGGSFSFTATSTGAPPNVDLAIEIQNSAGAVLAYANPAGTAAATVSASLGAGTYYVKLSPSGNKNAATDGYSTYGSIGAYTLTGTGNFLAQPVNFANLNGTFEDPSTAGYPYSAIGSPPATATQPWTFIQGGIAADYGGLGFGVTGTPTGQYAYLQGNGASMSQSVYFPSAGTYDFRFVFAGRDPASGGGGTTTFTASISGGLLSDSYSTSDGQPFTNTSTRFTVATAGTYTLSFNNTTPAANGDQSLLVDSVRINRIPVATPQNVTATEDTVRSITLAGTDPDGGTIVNAGYTVPLHGHLTTVSPLVVTYTPDWNYSGTDSFSFLVVDSDGSQSDYGTVSITVGAVNDAPSVTFPRGTVTGLAGGTWTGKGSGSRNWSAVASSADGSRLAAVEYGGAIYTSSNFGTTWTPRGLTRNWQGITSSADGMKLAAVAANTDFAYTSIDGGVTWTARSFSYYGSCIASSSDGTKLAGTTNYGLIYTSTNSGVNWTSRASNQYWSSIASSSNGTMLAAVVNGGQIYTSTNSGLNWTARATSRAWSSIASSSNGTMLAAAVNGGQIYTSTDSGLNWTAQASGSRAWKAITSSSDGTKLTAVADTAQIYTSSNSGVTWVASESSRAWRAVGSSEDGARLVAGAYPGDLYTSAAPENLYAVTVPSSAGATTIVGLANVVAGPADESGQTMQAYVSNNNSALFSSQPFVSSAGTLTFTPASSAAGTATVSVYFSDNGGTANGGINVSATQTFNITVIAVAPANDAFASAPALVGNSASASGSNADATGETGEPDNANASAPIRSVWWQWTAPANGTTTISLAGSSFDTTLGVYTGASVNALATIAMNDDFNGSTSSVTFSAVSGTTYRISVSGYRGATGSISLALNNQVTPAPTVTLVAPATGTSGGGTSVTITGTNLTGATAVTIGGTAATNVTVVNATMITATTPAHAAGTVDVAVTTTGGTGTGTNLFTYVTPPTVTAISPTSASTAGGTSVTITGTNLTGATAVTIGGTAATNVTVVNATTITATTPAHAAGTVDVAVTTAGGTGTGTNLFTYVSPPTVTAISPTGASAAGGTAVTITGTNLTGATAVTIGGTAATNVTVVNATTITATTPAHATGTVDVAVTTAVGTGTGANLFTYGDPPTVTTPTSTNITSTDATLGGNVTSDGGATITERGVVYALTATNANPIIGGTGVTKITAAGLTGIFTATASSLTGNSGYSFQAYAINSVGTTYSGASIFTTLPPVAPTVTTPTSAGITQISAAAGGNVTSDGGAAITERGVVYSITTANNDPLIGGAGVTKVTGVGTTGVFTVNVTGLTANTGYSFKAYATNSAGTTYTAPVSTFSTLVAVPLAGTKTVGTGGNYASLTNPGGLFEAINGNGVNGTLNVQVITDLTGETGASALNALTGTTPSVKIFPTAAARVISGSITGALIRLNGADDVTLDGSLGGTGTDRSLTITNTSTATSTAIALISLGAGLGATNNVIRNCNISTGVATSIGYGIAVGGSSPGTNGADNDNVTIQNNSITGAPVGIYASGTASASAGGNDNLSIIGNSIAYNSTLVSIGIQVRNARSSSVSQNTVSEQTTANGSPTAISIETGFVSSSVTRNTVTKSLTTSPGGYAGRGITVGTGTATSALTIANNSIYGVNGSNWPTFGDSSAVGIAIGTIGGSTVLTTITGGVNLYFNSVTITGSMGAASTTNITAAIYIGSGASALDIRNNVFANTQVGTSTTQKNYAIYSAAGSTAFTTIDYNDYFVSNTFNAASAIPGFLTSDRLNLAGMQAGFGQNTHSFTADPLFTSTTDLHITSGYSPVSNAGTPLAGVQVDIDGDPRNATAPDVGADEFTSGVLTTITTPTQTAITADGATLGGNVTSDGGSTINARGVVYARTSDNPNPQLGGNNVAVVNDASNTTGVFTENLTGLASGTGYSFVAFASNSAGTAYTTPVSTFTTVALPPTLTAVTIASNNANPAAAKVGDTITLSFTASKALQTPTVFLAGRSASVTAIGTGGTNWTAAITVGASETEGAASLSIAYQDLANNNGTTASTTTDGSSVNIDRTAPAAPTTPALAGASDTGSSNSDGITQNTVLNFTGTAEVGATITLYDTDGTTVRGTGTATGGNYSINTTALGQGAHTITAKASDAAGNVGTGSSGTLVTIDTTAPTFTLPANLTAEATGPGGKAVDYTASVSDAGGSGVDTSSFLPASGSTFAIATATVNASATDKAGNTATGSFTITVQDTTPPAIAIAGANPATVERLATYTDAGATATDLVDGTRTVTTTSTVNTAVAGAYTVSYTATDTRSNSRTVTRTVNVVDTVAPTVVMSSVATDPPTTLPIPVTVTFSESVTGFTAGDIATGNATVSNFTGSGASYSFSLVPNGAGLVTADIAANAAQDGGGNGNTAAAQFSRTVVNPAISISATDANASEGGSDTGIYRFTRSVSSSALVAKFRFDNTVATTASTADFSLSGGNVTFDTTTRNGTVTFPAGQITVDVTLTALVESVQAAEPAETVKLIVDADTGYTVGSPDNATITIAQNGFVVVNLNDAGDGSLRQAVANANALAGTDTITFSDGMAGTINFADGTARTITLTSGQLAPTSGTSVNIVGPGASLLSLSGNNVSRVLSLGNGTCVISGLTLTKGNASGGFGVAVFASGTALTFNDCRFTGNTPTAGSGTAPLSVQSGSLTLNRTTFSGNVVNNVSGIYMQNTTAVIRDCTFSGNSGSGGESLRLNAGSTSASLTLINSTISGNSVTGSVGSAMTFQGSAGGTATATLTNCTVTNNTGSTAGMSALLLQAGPAFAVTLNNTIVSGNTAAGTASNISGIVLAASANNLIGTTAGGLTNGTNGNKIGIDNPQLAALASNGGPTQTRAPLFGSPAIDAGNATLARDQLGNTLAFDQRGAGFDRAFGTVDIGAYELQKSIAIVADPASASEGTGGGNTTFAFTLSRTGDTSTATTVEYAVAGSGANPANAADFANATLPSGLATFAAGAATVPISINVNKDALAEFDEAFIVTLANPTGGYILSGASASSTITNDDALTVTIDQAATQADPAATSPINFTAIFSEAVSGFDLSDVTLSGTAGATSRTVTEIVPNDGTTYRVGVSGMTTGGTVIAAINAGRAQSLGGVGNLASTSTDNSVLFDNVPPVTPGAPLLAAASDSGSSNSDGITSNTALTFTGTAEAGTTVQLFDGATAGNTATATGGSYTIAQTLSAGTHSLTVKATDAAGNTSAASAAASVIVDTTAPSVTPPASGTVHATSPTGVVVNYSAATATDNVTVSPAMTYSKASGTNFIPGLTSVNVTATDAAGNAGTATFTVTVTPLTAAELWRWNNFGSAGNIGSAAALADPDGDGLPNVVELGFFTDPNNASSGTSALQYSGTFAGSGTILATGQPRAMSEGSDMRAIFVRRSDFAAAGLSYIVEFTADFTTWAASDATPAVLAENGTAQIVSVPYALLVDGKEARFFRVIVTVAP